MVLCCFASHSANYSYQNISWVYLERLLIWTSAYTDCMLKGKYCALLLSSYEITNDWRKAFHFIVGVGDKNLSNFKDVILHVSKCISWETMIVWHLLSRYMYSKKSIKIWQNYCLMKFFFIIEGHSKKSSLWITILKSQSI